MAQRELKGIGGWLVLLAILQVATLVFHAIDLAQLLPAASHLFALQPIVVGYELIANLVTVTLILYTTLLLFRRRQAFPFMLRVQLWTVAVLHLCDFALTRLLIGPTRSMWAESGEMVGHVVAAIGWSAYTLLSVRVRNTFVT
jgi:hypothetical protein